MMETEPWKIVNHLFPDLVFLVEGKKLYYHQAVIAQHSQIVRSILLKNNCCKCGGVDCSRNAGNIFITLDDVNIDTVQYVMDMIYAGSGSIAGDTQDYKNVLDMLQINTIVVDALSSQEGFVLEEILNQVGSDVDLDMIQVALQGPPVLLATSAQDEAPRLVDKELKETNKALKRLEREKKKLAAEEKKLGEVERKRDLRVRNKKRDIVEKQTRQEESTENIEKAPVKEPEINKVQTKVVSVESTKPINQESVKVAKSISKDDDCEIILDSAEGIDSKIETKTTDAERFICPFSDCHSESRNVQSIKVHLALVHYKKSIQSEFPNWKKQKCDECDKSFGQMTAYYLHMANHKKYQYMDLPAHAMTHKEGKPVLAETYKHSYSVKPNNSKRNSIISSQAIVSKPPVPSSTSSSVNSSLKTSGAVLKTSVTTSHVRSSSHSQDSAGVTQSAKGYNSMGSALTRSKSFIQSKTQPYAASKSQQPIIKRTQSGGNTGFVSPISSLGRTAPPGPPGPSTATIKRTNSFSKISSPNVSTSSVMKTSTPPISSHQRRLSAPYSVVTKRVGSIERPISKNSGKNRGS